MGITAPLVTAPAPQPFPTILIATTIAGLQQREPGEHEDLGEHVCGRGQSDRLLAQEDRPLADERPDRQRGAHEDGADVEQHQNLPRLVRRFAALDRGLRYAEADVARHRQ